MEKKQNIQITRKDALCFATKKFSNKKYTIKIDFYEHDMAVVGIQCKKRGYIKTGRWCAYVSFDQCKSESMYDYFECLDCLDKNKTARRWFIREMRHCTRNFLFPNGRVDRERTKTIEREIHHCSCLEIPRISPALLKQLISLCRGELYGSLRGVTRISCENGEIKYNPKALQNPIFVRKVVNRIREKRIVRPVQVILNWIKDVLPGFYQKIEQERTIDNCKIIIWYRWRENEYPSMEICVNDCAYTIYTMI